MSRSLEKIRWQEQQNNFFLLALRSTNLRITIEGTFFIKRMTFYKWLTFCKKTMAQLLRSNIQIQYSLKKADSLDNFLLSLV